VSYPSAALRERKAAVTTQAIPAPPALRRRTIPLWVKVVYTAFVAVLVPFYLLEYGPTNFLYFCDVALLMTLAAVWLESPLLASMPAVGILLPQALWQIDFLGTAVGLPITHMTDYMYDSARPLFTRGLSFFHFWLPLFLLWLVWRLGYDRRACVAWTLLAWVLLLVCYFLMPPPPVNPDYPNRPVNINYVYGLSDTAAQTWMPAPVYFTLVFLGLPVLIFLPTHLLLLKLFPPARRDPVEA
jgi:hypothetical protein